MNGKSSTARRPTQRIRVQIDTLTHPQTGVPLWFPALTTGARWNGFATPWFDKETADRLMDTFNRQREARDGHGARAIYDAEHDAYVFIDDDVDDGEETFRGERFNGRTLYPIGAWAWSWSAAGDFEPSPD